ncbi:MAG: imidazole glycerol phosphate synthase subunit HisH [Roseivirga sp.]|nr:imidazole glycerol phosphate synthase subunit HisH [Roseivirga sp.]
MKQPNIVIIDYGVGNTYSVGNAIKFLGYKRLSISDNPKEIEKADALILPGVGAFEEAVKNLKSRNLIPLLNEQVLNRQKPILGICVGMQLLATDSNEKGIHPGLDWIKGRVEKLELKPEFAVPHVGWNNVSFNEECPLFTRNEANANFYFDHSYYFNCENPDHVVAHCKYDIEVTAAVQKDNIFGVQFHPEKSQTSGLKLFRSFFNAL